ncbi:MAG: LolA family protein [Desulfonatronovibrio sp.]
MNCKISAFTLAACMLFLSAAGVVHASDVAKRLQKHYETIESFQAGFVQILTNASTKEQEERVGSVSFQKPLNVRWESTSPEEELLLIDQDTVLNYFPQENALYRYETDEVLTSRNMIRFISGQARLTQDFQVEDQDMEHGLHKIKLIPKNPEPDLVMAYIWSDDEGMMRRILLVDFFGNGNELRLKDIELNPEFEKDFFSFEPPEDVEVIENHEP